jgi:hypothetical protein
VDGEFSLNCAYIQQKALRDGKYAMEKFYYDLNNFLLQCCGSIIIFFRSVCDSDITFKGIVSRD